MKKYILSMIFIVLGMIMIAQDRTVTLESLKNDVLKTRSVTWSYAGVTADTLTTNQDTLQVVILLNKSWPAEYYLRAVLDTIAGADTTVVINVKGKMFDAESYTLIETVTTSAISASTATVIESITDAAYSISMAAAVDSLNILAATDTFNADSTTTVAQRIASYNAVARAITITPSIKKSYRYLMLEFILSGNDLTGTGVKLTRIDGYIQEAK